MRDKKVKRWAFLAHGAMVEHPEGKWIEYDVYAHNLKAARQLCDQARHRVIEQEKEIGKLRTERGLAVENDRLLAIKVALAAKPDMDRKQFDLPEVEKGEMK